MKPAWKGDKAMISAFDVSWQTQSKDSAGSKEDTRPVADRTIMEAFYDMLNEAAEAVDTDALEQSCLEMKDYPIPKEDEDIFKQLEEAFKSFDYGKLQTVLSSRNSGS